MTQPPDPDQPSVEPPAAAPPTQASAPPPPPVVPPPPPPVADDDPSIQPDRVKVIGLMLTISGGLNVFAALAALVNVALTALSTWGVGLIFCFIPIVLGIAGYFGLMDGIKLLQRRPGLKPPTVAAYAQIGAIIGCNVVSLALGIIILVFLGEEPVKDFYARQERR